MITVFIALLQREWLIARRRIYEMVQPVLFFLLALILLRLVTVHDTQVPAAGLIWILVLLANLLATEHIFHDIFRHDILAQWIMAPVPLYVPSLATIFHYWMVFAIGIAAALPVSIWSLALPTHIIPTAMLAVWIGSGTLCAISSIGAALATAAARGGLLIALLMLPFYIPVLLLGTSAIQRAQNGMSASTELLALSALCLLSLALAPVAVSWALRIGAETQ